MQTKLRMRFYLWRVRQFIRLIKETLAELIYLPTLVYCKDFVFLSMILRHMSFDI